MKRELDSRCREPPDISLGVGTCFSKTFLSKFETRYQKTNNTQAYAPTNDAAEQKKENFYAFFHLSIGKVPKRDIVPLMGDFHAKVWSQREGREREMSPHGLGTMNENNELFADLCEINQLITGGGGGGDTFSTQAMSKNYLDLQKGPNWQKTK